MSKVPVNLPSVAKVVGSLDQHGSRSEGLEVYDDVGEVELRLQVEGYGHVLHTVFRLPPRFGPASTATITRKSNDAPIGCLFNVLPADDVGDVVLLPRMVSIAEEALFPIFQVGNDAVSLGLA